MNTKPIPAVVALAAGFITCVKAFIQHTDIAEFAKTFAIVCIIFYMIGFAMKLILDKAFNNKKDDDDQEQEQEAAQIETDTADDQGKTVQHEDKDSDLGEGDKK